MQSIISRSQVHLPVEDSFILVLITDEAVEEYRSKKNKRLGFLNSSQFVLSIVMAVSFFIHLHLF